ncbi:hypothetical protein IJ843_01775 [bacterium]|nr:hypothetical protein [bacterium]
MTDLIELSNKINSELYEIKNLLDCCQYSLENSVTQNQDGCCVLPLIEIIGDKQNNLIADYEIIETYIFKEIFDLTL